MMAFDDSTAATGKRADHSTLEIEITNVGRGLSASLGAVLESVPGAPHGPQKLATTLGLDKVLTSRVLKAARHRDPMAVVHLLPGPDPMRRLIRAAQKHGTPKPVIDSAAAAVDAFERLIREEAGDRSSLDAIIATWLPDARAQFELRRKQALYKATSLLKGAVADVIVSTVILHPSADGAHIDVVWVSGFIGLQRLRPGVEVKLTTRRLLEDTGAPRDQTTLDGTPVNGQDGLNGVLLEQFCDSEPAKIELIRAGDVTHYMLKSGGFTINEKSDLIIGEVNIAELPRTVPVGSGRKGYVFSEISTTARTLNFDAMVHEDLYPGTSPELLIYDTSFDGVANVNDRTRDIDRMDLLESIQSLGRGAARCRVPEMPNYVDLVRWVFDAMGWDDERFRTYRCRIDFPLYGSQVAMAFDAPEA